MPVWFCIGCGRHHDNADHCVTDKLKHIERVVERIEAAESSAKVALQDIGATVLRIEEALHRPPGDGFGHTTIHVVEVGPITKETPMPPATDHAPDFKLNSSDDYAVLAVVGAKRPDGSYVPGTDSKWDSTTPANLVALPDEIATNDDGTPKLDDNGNQIPVFKVRSNTPGDDGNDTVTWSAPQMAPCDIHVIWSTPPVGHVMIQPSELPE